MQGTILDYAIQTNTGVISGDDQQRYNFSGSEWQGQRAPTRGDRVDFNIDAQGNATQIYIAINHNSPINQISDQLNKLSDQNKHEEQYNPIDWFVKSLKNYANFSGRARRKEYWFFILVQFGVILIASVIDSIIFKKPSVLYMLTALALFIPSLAVSVRRLHDIGKSGWWYLICLIPLIGAILLIVWFATETKPETNQWGQPAK